MSNKTMARIGVLKGKQTTKSKGKLVRQVGGAHLDKVTGNYTVEAGAGFTIVGAFLKFTGSSSVKFTCGGSEVAIDSGSITFKSSAILISGSSIARSGGSVKQN
jgi:phage baseplate assembly protein gpV